jgi:hypothetical protein
MADAFELLQNMKSLDVKATASEAAKDNEGVMAGLNATQMSQGKRATGTDIRPDYHPLTVELKSGRSGLAGVTDRVTLYDTGSHYRQLYADVVGDEIVYGSRDMKSAELQKKYGAIYGLNEESKDELVEGHLKGSFYQKVREATGL